MAKYQRMKSMRLAATICAAAGATLAGAGSAPESTEPVKLVVTDAVGQVFQSHVIGEVLARQGYNIEYVAAGYYTQVQGLADGAVHMTPELWSSNMGDGWLALFDEGMVLDAGVTFGDAVETWYANDKALEACPGLAEDWTVLKSCAQALATAETFPKGRLLDYPIEWGDSNIARIAALDLPLVSQSAGSEGAMVSEIAAAEDRGEPLIMQFWRPHQVFANYNLTEVPLPDHFEGCETDPAGGVNPTATYDCDWSDTRVWKAAWPGARDTWPLAYRIFENFHLEGSDISAAMDAVNNKGQDIDSYVGEWLSANEDRWQSWVSDAKNGG